MKNLIALILACAFVAGCGNNDDGVAQPASTAPARVTHAVQIERIFPPSEDPIIEMVDAPVDVDSVALAIDLGDYWTPTWTTSGPLAIYGQTPFWIAYRPQGDGCRIVIRYEHMTAPTVAQ